MIMRFGLKCLEIKIVLGHMALVKYSRPIDCVRNPYRMVVE